MDSLTQKITDRAYDWTISYEPKIIFAFILLFLGQWVIRLLIREMRKNIVREKG